MSKFSKNLVLKAQIYFEAKHQTTISDDEAEIFLHGLAGYFITYLKGGDGAGEARYLPPSYINSNEYLIR